VASTTLSSLTVCESSITSSGRMVSLVSVCTSDPTFPFSSTTKAVTVTGPSSREERSTEVLQTPEETETGPTVRVTVPSVISRVTAVISASVVPLMGTASNPSKGTKEASVGTAISTEGLVRSTRKTTFTVAVLSATSSCSAVAVAEPSAIVLISTVADHSPTELTTTEEETKTAPFASVTVTTTAASGSPLPVKV